MERMKLETTVTLFQISARGVLARMFMARGIEPTERHLDLITGGSEITMRDIGEIAFGLGFDAHFSANDIPAIKPEAEND